MPKVDAVSILSKTALFGELNPPTIDALSDRSIARFYKKGQLIFHQGDKAESLYVVVQGLVKIGVVSESGEEMVLAILRPYDTFGELALLDGRPRSATAEAAEDTQVLAITRQFFLGRMETDDDMIERTFHVLGTLLRKLTDRNADFVFLDLQGRVAKFLLQGAGVSGAVDQELDLDLTQKELASMLGGSRQSINQILRSFEAKGYIAVDGRSIRLLQPERLRYRAGL